MNWTALITAVVMLAGGMWIRQGLWRRWLTVFDEQPRSWVWSSALWEAIPRFAAVLVLGCGAIAALTAPLPSLSDSPPGCGALTDAYAVLLIGVLVSVPVLVASITLFNRPRRLVPPHLRSHPGGWRARLRGPEREQSKTSRRS